MKKLYAFLMLFALPVLNLSADEAEKKQKFDVMTNPQACKSLVDACRIVALVNDLKWDEVDKIATIQPMNFLKRDAEISKEWQGVGAYKNSDSNESTNTIRHVFLYGNGRHSAHQVWIDYKLTETGYEKPNIMVLGW